MQRTATVPSRGSAIRRRLLGVAGLALVMASVAAGCASDDKTAVKGAAVTRPPTTLAGPSTTAATTTTDGPSSTSPTTTTEPEVKVSAEAIPAHKVVPHRAEYRGGKL